MNESLPIVLLPGLFCTPRLFADQIGPMWKFGPVTIADHTRDDNMETMAQRVLDNAPRRFALAGLSMGGYLALEIMRQAPARVAKLALLDTSARPDTPEQTRVRKEQIELTRTGQYGKVVTSAMPLLIHKDESLRATIRQMADDTGPDAFIRQQTAIMGRSDSRPLLNTIHCLTWVIVGEQDRLIPYDRSKEIADGIKNAHLVVIPESGHLTTLEQPAATTQALTAWLQE